MRKVYWDLMIEKLKKGRLLWVIKPVIQFPLIHLSYIFKRPLCGPILGTIITNYTCNYKCKMCDIPLRDKELRNKGLKQLSTKEMKKIIRDFAKLGISGIGFTGGEPLLRKDIFELLAYTQQLGMCSHLNTNGYYLTQENVKRLFEAKTDSLNMSLDGATAKTHDTIRGCKDGFERSVEAIRNINKYKKENNASLRVKIVSVLSEQNIFEVPDILKLAKTLEVDCVELIPLQPFSSGGKTNLGEIDEKFKKQIKKTMNYLIEQKKQGVPIENSYDHIKLFLKSFKGEKCPLKCYAGYNSYAIDCYGEIYPCIPWINWGKDVGNIGDMDLKKFWYSRKYNKIRPKIDHCKDCFINCQTELNILFN